ncbi:MAG: T9SS type A sorting domain-containing protein [Candidatus Eisenbacteria sp.]|nr:T9SS type A sorting domain-containing protein [Candidatus Eisenbacteria bacterium]
MPNGSRMGAGNGGMVVSCAMVVLLGLSGAVVAGPPCPCPDEVRLTKGDEYVVIEWTDPPDSLLYSTEVNTDNWSAYATPLAWGFRGDCDNEYEISMAVSATRIQVLWADIMRGEQGDFDLEHPDSAYSLPDNVWVRFPSTAATDLASWGESAEPHVTGFFAGADSALYTLTAESHGTVDSTEAGTTPGLTLAWTDSLSMESGTLAISRADTLLDFDGGLRISFARGEIHADSSFAIRVWRDVADDDVLRINGSAFGGYKIWRSDVNDLGEPRLIQKITMCDSADPDDAVFFRCGGDRFFVDGVDPWYQDDTCTGQIVLDSQNQIRTTGDVTNAFPYWYGVTTFDTKDGAVLVDPDVTEGAGIYWKKIYPSQAPRTNVSDVRVIPNPYNVREEWEEGEAKITFDNLPSQATVYVYNVIGEMIIKLEHDSITDDFISWNLKSGTGRDVVSGVYLYKVESSEGDKIGKFIVIR